MIDLWYSPEFIRTYKKLPIALKEEVLERIEVFRNPKNHQKLKVHKLKGELRHFYAFSVDYRHRIIFDWGKDKTSAYLHDIGDHGVYE